MFVSRNDGRTVTAIVAVALIALGSPVLATEPDGPFGMRAERIEGTGESLLQVTLNPALGGSGARFTYLVPDSFLLEPRSVPFEDAGVVETADSPGWKIGTLELGDLRARTPIVMRFALRYPEGAAAIVELVVTADGAGDRPLRDAVGLVVGRPGAVAVVRNGAVEYRAVPAGPEDLP